jgi:hypothetical protein
MYEGTGRQLSSEGSAQHAANEGLYDEPAFNKATSKENPVFDDDYSQVQSTLVQHASAQDGYLQADQAQPLYDNDGPSGYLEAEASGIALTQQSVYGDAELAAGDGYLDVAPDQNAQ